jgi:hypothetical protein
MAGAHVYVCLWVCGSGLSAGDCPSVRPFQRFSVFFFNIHVRRQSALRAISAHFAQFSPCNPLLLSLTHSLPHSLILSLPHSSHSSHSLILASVELFYLHHARSRGVDFAREHGEILSE